MFDDAPDVELVWFDGWALVAVVAGLVLALAVVWAGHLWHCNRDKGDDTRG